MIGQQREPFVIGAVAGIQSGRLAHQMVAQGFEGRRQRTFAANELLSRLRNKLLRNRLHANSFDRAEACQPVETISELEQTPISTHKSCTSYDLAFA